MRSYSILVVFSLMFPVAGPSQETARRREPLVTGTSLYKWCGAAKEIRKDKDGHMSFSVDSSRMSQTMICLGYSRGVVDSIGVSDKPELDNDKRLERYFETVYMFLDRHPERRGESAANLVKEALQVQD
jgi:Rap1a immunity proteins